MLLTTLNKIITEYSIIIFCLNIIILTILCFLLIKAKDERKKRDKFNDYLWNVTKTVDSVRYGNLTKKINSIEFPDSENLSDSINRMIETLHDRENMVVEYQNELAQQNKLLEGVINSLSEGLIIIDSQDKILRTTPNIAEWFGLERKKLIGHNLSDYIQVCKKKPIQFLRNDDVIVNKNKNQNFSASTVELKSDDKRNRYIVILKNITDQKELETLKEDFVATLTHDLKVPIIAETNMLELFIEEKFGKISEKQKQALQNMQTSNRELLELVQTVLDTYKFKDGKISLYKENILLKGFINEIISEMLPLAQKTSNTINFILERDIRVFADRFQLKRVIKNLIQNAISYGTPKSPINITIGEIPNYIIIKVKDKGAGISKDDIDKIFNKYYSAAKKFRKIGTGLGLYLALQIIKAHNGDLIVESVEGEYTEFCIKIPALDYEPRFI